MNEQAKQFMNKTAQVYEELSEYASASDATSENNNVFCVTIAATLLYII